MKQRTILIAIILLFSLSCASTSKEGTSEEPGLMNKIIEKANSEEGQKAIQMGKEKLQDPETQEKLKGLLSKEKKKKEIPGVPAQ
ncbi:hypothetical protein ND861_04985 [Leptospira sp. 2 VSF19]|uniref:Lipoprotein n=1 Tax=Leptospira soteropolitanensis TaxID=2950025 RepID=A0AAW5VBN8_9LEPT|nr:hypothetical protein [Leptospira soteropolitanensis]MCW7492006.1 hypothetical protein [Leptospira soteropolitanensis]MCW7499588.1 hypothetical protein [Leptospira soteropolitanensis]MCW7521839.1 hypothetical protein [Leptospira soteropolitanensis]MCW7525693.1 hypothetical protein [Leptospira soteropolitanensis]MCW7530193.1 hypothetical protein [Leptospira soteropolitanensis]